MQAGVAIVGGGIMGAWVALEASRRADPLGGPAVLFEGAPSDAVVVPDCGLASESLVPTALVGVARIGMREAANFETNTGRAIQFGRPGALVLGCEDPAGVCAELEARRTGVASVLEGDELARKLYGVSLVSGERGVWLPEVGHLDAGAYLGELLGLARTRGAITRFGTDVTAIRVLDGRVVGVETSRGFCETARVVVTAPEKVELVEVVAGRSLGLESRWVERARFHAPLVVEEAGLGAGSSDGLGAGSVGDVLSDPAKVESFFAPGEPPTYAHPALVDVERGVQFWCEPAKGTLVVAGSSGEASQMTGCELPGDAQALRLERLPFHGDSLDGAGELERLRIWTGASGLPVVGPVAGVEGLFMATGVGEQGVELAPGLAQGLVQWMDGQGVTAFDPGAFGF